MKVPFLDLRTVNKSYETQFHEALSDVLDGSGLVLGEQVGNFERELAQFCSAKYCVSMNSGLDALHLTLKAYGIGLGDEVIVPAHTFIATWLAVTHTGATPIGVETNITDYNIDITALEKAVSKKLKPLFQFTYTAIQPQ